MTTSSRRASRGLSGDGIPQERALPVTRDLALAYALSLLVAALMTVVSVAGLVFGSRGLYGLDTKIAAGVTTGPAGVLVPGFLAQDSTSSSGCRSCSGRCGSPVAARSWGCCCGQVRCSASCTPMCTTLLARRSAPCSLPTWPSSR